MLNQNIYKSTIGVHACGFGRMSEAVGTAQRYLIHHNCGDSVVSKMAKLAFFTAFVHYFFPSAPYCEVAHCRKILMNSV